MRGGNNPRQEGAKFEADLALLHSRYYANGLASVYHNLTCGRFVGPGKFIVEPSRPDYSGTLAGGVSVHFDAKTMGDVRGWRLSRDRLHQYDDLLMQSEMGALAFFLVECRPIKCAFILRVHPSIAVVNSRPEAWFTEIPMLDDVAVGERWRSATAVGIEADCDGLYNWLEAVEIWTRRRIPAAVAARIEASASACVHRKTGHHNDHYKNQARNNGIRQDYFVGGLKKSDIARKYNLSWSNIKRIVSRPPVPVLDPGDCLAERDTDRNSEIRRIYDNGNGASIAELAEKYNLTPARIYQIVNTTPKPRRLRERRR